MATMNAAVIHHYGSTQELHLETVPRPEPGAGEVLVAVAAAGINPGGYKTREGSGGAGSLGDHPFPLILGWDVAGAVAAGGGGGGGLPRGGAGLRGGRLPPPRPAPPGGAPPPPP